MDNREVIVTRLIADNEEKIMQTTYSEAKTMICHLAQDLNYGISRSWGQVDADGTTHEFWDVGPQVYKLTFIKDKNFH